MDYDELKIQYLHNRGPGTGGGVEWVEDEFGGFNANVLGFTEALARLYEQLHVHFESLSFEDIFGE